MRFPAYPILVAAVLILACGISCSRAPGHENAKAALNAYVAAAENQDAKALKAIIAQTEQPAELRDQTIKSAFLVFPHFSIQSIEEIAVKDVPVLRYNDRELGFAPAPATIFQIKLLEKGSISNRKPATAEVFVPVAAIDGRYWISAIIYRQNRP